MRFIRSATRNNQNEMIEFLIKIGANVNEKDKNGRSALHEGSI